MYVVCVYLVAFGVVMSFAICSLLAILKSGNFIASFLRIDFALSMCAIYFQSTDVYLKLAKRKLRLWKFVFFQFLFFSYLLCSYNMFIICWHLFKKLLMFHQIYFLQQSFLQPALHLHVHCWSQGQPSPHLAEEHLQSVKKKNGKEINYMNWRLLSRFYMFKKNIISRKK